MKAILVLTFVALANARVFLPCEIGGGGHRPEILPPQVDPIHPNRPEVDPIHPNRPEVDPIHPEKPLPPGVLPEVPTVPEIPILPGPFPPFPGSNVESHVLNFPSDEDPQIRVHVNIKQDQFPSHRPARSIFDFWPSKPALPEIGNKPELPAPGNKPELPAPGNKPEIPGGNLPILPPLPEIPVPEHDGVTTFVYPNAQHQLVKMRVVYNKPQEIGIPPMTPYKIDFPEVGNRPWLPAPGNKPELPAPGNKPELPAPGNKPEIPGSNLPGFPGFPEHPIVVPMPPPIVGEKIPQVEIFLDIGEQESY